VPPKLQKHEDGGPRFLRNRCRCEPSWVRSLARIIVEWVGAVPLVIRALEWRRAFRQFPFVARRGSTGVESEWRGTAVVRPARVRFLAALTWGAHYSGGMARVHLLSLLLCAVLQLPVLAQASAPPPPVPVPADPQVNEGKPQGELPPRDWETPESGGSRAGRIVLGSLTGLLMGTVAAAPGVLLMSDSFSCSTCVTDSEVIGGGLLSLAGLTAGGALGVKLMGSLLGGEGRYLHTLLGAGVGFGAGIMGALPLVSTEGGWAIPLFTFPIIGAVVGYEVSHSNERERKAAAGPGVAVLPSVSVRPLGGVVAGLMGRF
jgi:hypothetical protein